tara:strand:- start:1871 stop:3289 length:1419 start_codon:yes stop_codon:yes gene_type:complete
MRTHDKLFINGEWVLPDGKGSIDVINPTTEDCCACVPCGNSNDLDKAVMAARVAFSSWSQTPAAERGAFIAKLAEKITENVEEIAALVAEELGMPLALSKTVQVGLPIAVMTSYTDMPAVIDEEERLGNSLLIKEAIGVCAFITPWNLPLHQIVAKVAPALAAGCTMILKPSSETPLTALYFAGLVAEVGLPPGVFNLVTGSGKVVGEAMAMHPDIDMVSITGSTSAGIRVAELAASTVKRVSQELGGKSACIVLDDADLDLAVESVVRAVCMNSGQVCAALTRLILPRAKYKRAIAIAKMTAESVVVGGAFDDGAYMGPMVSRLQQEKVFKYIDKGIGEGATLVTGGVEMPDGISKGFFVKPTIFADVKNDMIIAQEEIFGPVVVLIPYDSEAEAIEIANESVFGLSGAVWGNDVDHAIKVAKKMRTGQVTINSGEFNLSAPFGGYKQSGNGRELGVYGLHEFMEIKSLQL